MVVDADNKAQVRVVKTSGMSGSEFIFFEGLKAGEKVIVDGLQKVRPGAAVSAIPWQPDQPILPDSGRSAANAGSATH